MRGQLYSPAALPPGKTYFVHFTLQSVSQNVSECRIGKDLEGSGRALTKVLPKHVQRLSKTIKILIQRR